MSATANDSILVTGTNALTITGGSIYLYQPGTTNSFTTPGLYLVLAYNDTLQGAASNLRVVNPVAGMTYTFATTGLAPWC